MKNFYKSIILIILFLCTYTHAQFGGTPTLLDTSRFIPSSQTYGLILPHQDIIIGKLDTTITSAGTNGGNGYKVITGSLLNWDDNCVSPKFVGEHVDCSGSYERWRELEKSTSWYQAARGDTVAQFPTNYVITISTGQDSVVIWDKDTGDLWMAFKQGPDNSNSTMIGYDSGILSDIAFLDGILYVTDKSNGFNQWPMAAIDFLGDSVEGYYAGGHRIGTEGGIHNRNASGQLWYNGYTGTSIISDDVNAVSVIRDVFGLTDGLGRIDHWWIVATAGQASTYNPHANNIYDSNFAFTPIVDVHIDKRGSWFTSNNDASGDLIHFAPSMFDHTADSYTHTTGSGAASVQWSQQQGDARKLAWTTGATVTDVISMDGQFFNAPIMLTISDEGLYRLHNNPAGTAMNGVGSNARQRFSSTVNAPVEFGDVVLALAFEDNTTDSSPYNNTMTANNNPGTVAAVFGNGYSSVAGSSLVISGQSEFNSGVNSYGNAVSFWFKSHSATNPISNEYFFHLTNTIDFMDMRIEPDGTITVRVTDDSGSTADQIDPIGDYYDGKWHHVFFQYGGSPLGNFHELYIDGVLVGTTTTSAAQGQVTWTDLSVGAYGGVTPSNHFQGQLDDFVLMNASSYNQLLGPATIQAIHNEGRRKLNKGTPVFASTPDDALISNNVIATDALDNGIWAVAFSDANTVQVFDGRIPIQQITAPAGTVQDIALFQNPGSDSVGVVIATTTNLKWIQPSVNLEKSYISRSGNNPPYLIGETVVVDSSGITGLFWSIEDAINAAKNANRNDIYAIAGTYGAFDVTNATDMWVHGQVAGQAITPVQGMTSTTRVGNSYSTSSVVTGTVNRFKLTDMAFTNQNGGGAGNLSCTDLTINSSHFENLFFSQCDNAGLDITGSWNIFRNVNSFQNDAAGIILRGDTNQGFIIEGGVHEGNASAGIEIQMDDGIITGVLLRNNSNYNIYIGATSDAVLVDGVRWEATTVTNDGTNFSQGDNNAVAW